MKYILFCLACMIALVSCSKPQPPDRPKKGQTICLNMIVKNEAEVIRRCLDSVKDVIDTWIIVDTGSKDGTQKIIREHLKNIPGTLYERPWKNWGETRTEAFELAKGKGDYILFMDADDILEFTGEPKFPKLTEDVYFMWRGNDFFTYTKQQLVKGNLPWRWIGVTHEYLDCAHRYTSRILEGVRYKSLDDGSTRAHDPKKYWKNVELLQEGLKKEPHNTRYVFYLAESYYDAGEKAKALEWYQNRVDRGGWEIEEIFWSKFRIAYILQTLRLDDKIVIAAYRDAIENRPHRSEPYYYLATFFNNRQDYKSAYELIKAYDATVQPAAKDYLFNSDWIQDFGLLFQLSICAHYVGHFDEAIEACNRLIDHPRIPEDWRELAKSNRQYSLAMKK